MSQKWHQTPFDCLTNTKMCLWATLVPCGCQCMQAVDAMLLTTKEEEKNQSFMKACLCGVFLCCLGGFYNRLKLRENLDIFDSSFCDLVFWIYCSPCVATQEWMEVMEHTNRVKEKTIWEVAKQIWGKEDQEDNPNEDNQM